MNWSDLLAALALYLMLEGILPTVNPQGLKRFLASLTMLTDPQLRLTGALSMIAGIILLYVVRA